MDYKNTVLGLDIGSSHIKAVSILRGKDKNTLLRYAVGPSSGLYSKIVSESELDTVEAAETLKHFLQENGFQDKQAVVVIPEQKVFSKVITMPSFTNKDFKQAVEWEAEQHLPQPLSEVYLKHTIQERAPQTGEKPSSEVKHSTVIIDAKTKYIQKAKDLISSATKKTDNSSESIIDVLLVSVQRSYVDRYLSIINRAGLAPLGLEPTSIAAIRGVLNDGLNVPTMIINFGYGNTDFYFSVNNNLRFVRPIALGISSAIRAISEALDISEIQANQYLFTYGLQENVLNGKLREIITPVTNMLLEEFQKSKKYIESKDSLFGSESNKKIRRLVLIGGGALIPDIMVYLIQNVSAEVEIGDPWRSLDMSLIKDVNLIDSLKPIFGAAVGAGLK